ncbi:Mpo1 family 2-hydroxy fatty acid dioxygenase [Parachitinimonas caeni]|uniref:DUF962 domain-containing protein n=1 Tax=Parachitinimonas caeni TaxID=3031301 RepID=A0ABT7E5R8_9NEIS|nr:Mpo1-like protein [Parachitinimonas caeni]MDK2126805.1 DUF962 domain-containing protein [Parachitinimonas caeni]
MAKIDALFDEYGSSHQNVINKRIHWVCVPLITFSLLGMLWHVHQLVAIGFVVLSLVYYSLLSTPIMVGMAFISTIMIFGIAQIKDVFTISLAVFVLAWIGQFIGHKIEGKKPSFFKDIQFLLVGPIWLLGFAYRKFAIQY